MNVCVWEGIYICICIGYTMRRRSMIDLHNRGPKAVATSRHEALKINYMY